ncbi:uncharacterized protein LOC123292681 [Chrysoperla carnea]|uniref:uncharacterized protein LOC123292681 n=1 Tax=Chrysoperla carnea TaxID=189513 RepID=UPI001D069FDE|nr:uncharacterized protein LOC123292681 [Chrysoperla carnea]
MSNDLFWENSYQDDEEKSQKEFILSYYFTLLRATGPLDVGTLEETWREQIELFSDVSFYVTHGISNFLLNSRKFRFINGKIHIVDKNANEKTETELNKTNESKNSSINKMRDIIKIEHPTIDQIITYNIERNKSLIESMNNEDEKGKIKSQSLALKINSIITFSNVQKQDEIQICVRPAVEYSMYSMHESLRATGSYSFKYTVHLSDNELDILSCLLRKHVLLLDYRNDDTFEYLILSEKCVPEVDDGLNHFDSYLINNDKNGIFQFDSVKLSNTHSLEDEHFASEIKHKYITAVQKFLFECEIQKKIIRDQNNKIQKEVLQMALKNEIPNNKLQHQCINYLVFLRNLMEKQIKSFQDKALKILTFFNEIKSNNISNSNSHFGNMCSTPTWKLYLYETKEEFKKMRAVFEKFKILILYENALNLKTFAFVTMKEEPPDSLHSQLREIIKNNSLSKQQDGNTNIQLQILQEYIYGPYLGILNKPKQTDDTPVNNFNQAFSSGFVPKLYFVKPTHNLNVPNNKSNKTGKIKTNIREADTFIDISTFWIKNLKVPNKSVSVTENVDHEMKLRMSISKLNKYVFGVNNFNRFEIIVNSDCRKKLSTLNMTELSENLSEYIPAYLLHGRVFMSKEKLQYFDILSLPISIYFGSQTRNGFFEPFINIKCNFNRVDGLPHNIEVEIKKITPETMHTMDTISNNRSICDESICSQFSNLQMNASGYPFLNEQSESEVSRYTDSPKSILTRSTGAKPKQSINSRSKKQKRVTIDENLETCCICRDTFRKKPKFHLKCRHIFHKECILIWRQNNRFCPVCRQIIEYEEFPPL